VLIAIRRDQVGDDDRRNPARKDARELVDERNPSVADAGVKQFAKQRRPRPVAHGVDDSEWNDDF